jgi:HEAT repeat protein/Mg-chelatase subunit ChlD
MRIASLICITVVAFLVLLAHPDASARDLDRHGILRQARPPQRPSKPASFDELINEYNRLKAAKARNSDLGTMIRYASSFKEARVVEWLKGIYRNETDRYLRQTAISTLGNIRTNEAQILEWLINTFKTEKDQNLRRSILSTVGNMRSKESGVLAWLKNIVKDEKDQNLQRTAVGAIGNMRTKEAAGALLEIYEKVKKGGDASLLSYTIRALANVAEFLPLNLLVDLFKGATSPHDRSNVARAIAKLGTKEAIGALINRVGIDEKDPNISRYGERYRISSIIKEAARDCKDDEVVSWLTDEVLASRRIPESAKVALLKGFAERSRRFFKSERKREELKEQRRRQEEKRKKAEEAAKKDPDAPPPPPPPPAQPLPEQTLPRPVPAHKLIRLLDDRSPAVRGATAIFLAASEDRSVVSVLIEHLSEKDKDTLLLIIFALGELKAEEAVEPLTEMLARARWEVKAAVIDALGRIGDPTTVDELTKYLNSRRWQVRAAAISALARIRSKESVTALIERMQKEDGRLLGDIARALEKLTGLELGTDARGWKDWWKSARDRYVLPREVSASPETANPGLDRGPRTELAPTYHGIEIVSHKICFIIDISGSMSGTMQRAGQQPGGGTAKPGQPGSPGTADPSKKKEKKKEPIFKGKKGRVQPKNDTKIEFAKAELMNCIVALSKKVRFNIISFESNIQSWQKRLISASRENKRRAIDWVRAMTPRGSTNLGDALLKAFEDKDVDTIFVLSDGSPNSGKLPSTDMILSEVRRLNTARRIVIHTINFRGAKEFMRRLAEENGGEFVDY